MEAKGNLHRPKGKPARPKGKLSQPKGKLKTLTAGSYPRDGEPTGCSGQLSLVPDRLPGRANLALAISDGDEVAMMDADAHVDQADAHVEQPRGYRGGSAASSAAESPAEHWLQAAPAPGDAVVPSPLAGAWHHL